MTVLIDNNIIISLLNSRDKSHSRAEDLLTELEKPEYGMRVTTDYVLDEVLTTLWMHTHRKGIVVKVYNLVCHAPEFIRFEQTTPEVLDLAWAKWEQLAKWPEKSLSYTDCCIFSFMDKNAVGYLEYKQGTPFRIPRLWGRDDE